MIVKASIGFLTSDSDAQLIVDAQGAITGVTSNVNFATPSPTLVVMNAALNAFTVAVADAVNGGAEFTAIKNAKRAELASLLRQLASYVTITSAGDMAKLLSSGFPIQKPSRTPSSVPSTPGNGDPETWIDHRRDRCDHAASPRCIHQQLAVGSGRHAYGICAACSNDRGTEYV